jgi:hypothetical protein
MCCSIPSSSCLVLFGGLGAAAQCNLSLMELCRCVVSHNILCRRSIERPLFNSSFVMCSALTFRSKRLSRFGYYNSAQCALKDENGACHHPPTRTIITTWIYNVFFLHHTAAKLRIPTELGSQLRCPKASSDTRCDETLYALERDQHHHHHGTRRLST